MTLASTQGPAGVSFANKTVLVTATTAVTKGRFVAFTALVDASSPYAPPTVIHALAADAVLLKVIGLALEDIAAGATGNVCLQGVGKMLASVTHAVMGSVMSGDAGINAVTTAATTPVALVLEAGGAGDYIDVYVDGVGRAMNRL